MKAEIPCMDIFYLWNANPIEKRNIRYIILIKIDLYIVLVEPNYHFIGMISIVQNRIENSRVILGNSQIWLCMFCPVRIWTSMSAPMHAAATAATALHLRCTQLGANGGMHSRRQLSHGCLSWVGVAACAAAWACRSWKRLRRTVWLIVKWTLFLANLNPFRGEP
jgi:hypothetical protein